MSTDSKDVKPRIDPAPLLRALAAAQCGVITLGQAAELGLSRHSVGRLVDMREWRRVGPSLVFLHDLDPPWRALAWAGILHAGGSARIGGEGAAHLHGLTDEPPDQILIMIPHQRRLRDRPPWTFRREREGARSERSPGVLPRTTVEDTVLDLCTDERSALHWIPLAVQRGRTSAARLREAMLSRPRLAQRRLLLDLLDDARSGTESPLEVRYLRDVERSHGLPKGRRQVRRRRSARNDVGYEEFGLIIELDGHLGHDGLGRFRDFRRDNAALIDGRITLRYGWADVTQESCAVATRSPQC